MEGELTGRSRVVQGAAKVLTISTFDGPKEDAAKGLAEAT